RTLNHFIQDRMPNRRPLPHPCVTLRPTRVVGCLGKCKSSILSGLPQGGSDPDAHEPQKVRMPRGDHEPRWSILGYLTIGGEILICLVLWLAFRRIGVCSSGRASSFPRSRIRFWISRGLRARNNT